MYVFRSVTRTLLTLRPAFVIRPSASVISRKTRFLRRLLGSSTLSSKEKACLPPPPLTRRSPSTRDDHRAQDQTGSDGTKYCERDETQGLQPLVVHRPRTATVRKESANRSQAESMIKLAVGVAGAARRV